MVDYGYALSSEEHHPLDLVRYACRAEDLGFAFLSVSDHYHPWVDAQGNAPFVWSVLGAVATSTSRIQVGTGVTCPILRIHPAVVAQATATTAAMFGGRFFFGVGSGEALNEHVVGAHWPEPSVRLEMLEESIEIIRALWSGELYSHRGQHYVVEQARLYTLPDESPPIIVSASGEKSVQVAARIGDGFWGMGPDRDTVDRWRRAGGEGPRYAQVTCCWAGDVASARKTLADVWPNTALAGQLKTELALPSYFESAVKPLTQQQLTEGVPCGPEVGAYVESVRSYVDAGFDHVYFHQVGPDQDGFFEFFERELSAALP